jgi:S-adenosylmethionine-diacylglycerol 3-amino-3-carboxypropyl transferase
VTASLLSYLGNAQVGSFSAFSVSDFGSYADDPTYRDTWQALARVAQPGARVCERQFLVPRDPAALCDVGFTRDLTLEAALAAADNSVVYTLLAGALPGAGALRS